MGNDSINLSIITPCIRPWNLPIILQSINNLDCIKIEWIIVYDGDKIDNRILHWETDIKIIQKALVRKSGDATASMLRNLGLKIANGKFIFFLDDDTLIHKDLLKTIHYQNSDKVMFFKQLSQTLSERYFNTKNVQKSNLDTGQFVIPNKLKFIKWDNSEPYRDELPYIKKLFLEIGNSYIVVNKVLSFRNFIKPIKR